MISRKQIIENIETLSCKSYHPADEIWNSFTLCQQDHIEEILKKWDQIDDEIWGKIICMERNRRIAKAYARVPVLTITGSNEGFDGYKIGLNGFETSTQDTLVKRVKNHIGKGIRIKMDSLGNILLKRLSPCDVFIRGYDPHSNCLSPTIISLGGEMPHGVYTTLFDMSTFIGHISRESGRDRADIVGLERECISVIGFGVDNDVLKMPVWCMLINVVALDMLKSRLGVSYRENIPKFVSIFKPDYEDPYSVPSLPTSRRPNLASRPNTNTRAGEKEEKPPELPPRDFAKINKKSKGKMGNVLRNLVKERKENRRDNNKKDVDYEDPYYCGMQARVCNGPRTNETRVIDSRIIDSRVNESRDIKKSHSSGYLNSLFNPSSHFYPSRGSSYYSHYDSFESDPYVSSGDGYDTYAPIYGRLPYVSSNRIVKQYKEEKGRRFIPEWD